MAHGWQVVQGGEVGSALHGNLLQTQEVLGGQVGVASGFRAGAVLDGALVGL